MSALLLLPALLLQTASTSGAIRAVEPETATVRAEALQPRSVVLRGEAPGPYLVAQLPATPQGPFEYSDAYGVRLRIHKLASFATVPLFVLQYLAGEELIEGEGGTLADMHGGLAAGIAGLFVVNTVTGGWNLLEARKDPENRTWRTIHGLLMLAADAGFVATGISANSAQPGDADAHRAIAISSMGVALASYAMMLPPLRRE